MSAEYGDRLRAAFDAVMSVSPDERESFVREHYVDDVQLQTELLGMIHHMGGETSFLEPLDETDVHVLLGRPTESSEWPTEALPDLEGAVLAGRYAVGPKIGSGGASVVHDARDQLQDRRVAVKVLRQAGRRSRQALRRECSTLRLLRLPGVVQLLDDGFEGEFAFLVMERVEGNPFPGTSDLRAWADLGEVTIALLESLERMHRAGIVHGDLKPGNVLVRPDGVPVVLDLGIAEGPRAGARDPKDGARRGTLRYMAPEQVGGGLPTARSDLYAVAVMLHEALAGRSYRSDQTVALAKIGVVGEEPKPLGEDVPDLPEYVRLTVERMLAHDPDERPASAAEAVALLRPERVASRLPPAFPSEGRVDEAALRALFAGPDRLLHLREDAAAELWRRTGGAVDRLDEELDAWSRAGLGYRDDGAYRIGRNHIEQLKRGMHPFAAPREQVETDASFHPLERDLLIAIEIAGPRARRDLLAAVVKAEPDVVDALLESLERRGLVLREPEGPYRLPFMPSSLERALTEFGPRFHRRLATRLPRGDERRLRHLIEGRRLHRVPRASLEVAEALLEQGDPAGARVAAEAGLGALDADGDQDLAADLLEVHLMTAIQRSTRRAFDDHLHRLGRLPSSARVDLLERTARGALHVLDGQPERALDDLPGFAEAGSVMSLRCLVSTRIVAGRLCRGAVFEAEIERLEALSEADASPAIVAAATSARAWLAYQAGRYEEAGQLHQEVARIAPLKATRAMALLNAASASLDAGHLDRAADLAAEALPYARASRLATAEARAEYFRRAAAYRRGDALQADPELAEAAVAVVPSQLASMICVTEGAIAWRAGDGATAVRLARDAIGLPSGERGRWDRLLAEGLAVVAGPAPSAEEADRLLDACEACPSDPKAAQVAALVGRACPAVEARAGRILDLRTAAIPADRRGFRLEILSISEALK